MPVEKRFSGKVAIVTGSSNGIGRATAALFAEEGARVVLTGRNEAALNAAVEECELAGAGPLGVLSFCGDLRDESLQKKIVDETVAKFGRIDILVNNAGGSGPDFCPRMGVEQTVADYDYTMNINVRAIVSLTSMALPHLIAAQGEVVNVSSVSGLPRAVTGAPHYGMSKAALDQYTRAMGVAYVREGVRFNSINPGLVMTTLFEKIGVKSADLDKVEMIMSADHSKIPAGYVANARDIAYSIAFLADRKQSRYIIGSTLVVDGGSSLQLPLLNHEIAQLGRLNLSELNM